MALRRWHVPQSLIIPLAVTIRYFPAIREEAGYIRDAMKLCKVSGLQKLESFCVPLMVSATTTADELAAAAVTRGIENEPAHAATGRGGCRGAGVGTGILRLGAFYRIGGV